MTTSGLRTDGRANARAVIAAAAIAAAALSLCACSGLRTDLGAGMNFSALPVDPASPVAADVERARHISGPIPSFASIPPKPTAIRSADAYKSEVVDVVADRRGLAQWTAAHPPINTDTEDYAAAQRARLAKEQPVSPEREKESEAFAKKLRDAAQAPNPK